MRLRLLLTLGIFGSSSLAEPIDYHDYDSTDSDDGDIFVPPPETNPVVGFSEGPLPNFVELNLNLRYDPTLLKQFHGSKDNAEGFIKTVVELARPHLQQHQLKVKVRIKVTFCNNLYHYLYHHSFSILIIVSFFVCFWRGKPTYELGQN